MEAITADELPMGFILLGMWVLVLGSLFEWLCYLSVFPKAINYTHRQITCYIYIPHFFNPK